MARLKFEVWVTQSPELVAYVISQAIRDLQQGGRERAARVYRDMRGHAFVHPDSWSNLAALALGLDDIDGARQHAQRALAIDRAHAGAWINHGVASWHAGQRRDAAKAMCQALALQPGLQAAAINYALMLRVVERLPQAQQVLTDAVAANPKDWRLHYELACVCRLLERHVDARQHILATLPLLRLKGTAATDAVRSTAADRGDNIRRVLFAAADAFNQAGIAFHLFGGTMLALYRDGRPFPDDKDIDLALAHGVDRDSVLNALSADFQPMLRADDQHAVASRDWVMGFHHVDTGIGLDLMFAHEDAGTIQFCLGWPDQLVMAVPAYDLETLQWAGRSWHAPSPPERFLEAVYGPDWRQPQRHFDTQVSNASRTVESLPRAVTLGLLRLVAAIWTKDWGKARALCAQILAREELAEVRGLQRRLARHAPAN